MPSFGKDTIRKFVANTSELKKLAARNFEDLLQVGIFLHLTCNNSLYLVNTVRDPCVRRSFTRAAQHCHLEIALHRRPLAWNGQIAIAF